MAGLALAVAMAVAMVWAPPVVGQMQFAPRFRADVLTTDDGLPGQAITSLVQAEDGYLWIVASGVMTRFDGRRFQTVHPGGDGWPQGRLRSLFVGGGDTLWASIADEEATTVVRHADGGFTSVLTVPGPWGQVARDGDGTLWLGGFAAMARMADGALVDTLDIGMNIAGLGFGPELGPTVYLDRFGDLWTRDDDTRALLRLARGGVQRAGPAAAPILLTRPSTGDVLFTEVREGRMEVRDPAGSTLASYPESGGAVPLLVDRRDRLWVLDGEGLAVYPAASAAPVTRVAVPPGMALTGLVEDHQGTLWGSTVTSGLLRIRELPIHVVGVADGIRAGQVLLLAPARDGSVLATDRDGRAYRIGAEGVEIVYEYGSPEGSFRSSGGAHGLAEDRDGRLWFGTSGRTGTEGRHLVGRREGEPDVVVPVAASINAIAEDPRDDGTIWFGGVMLYRGRLTDSGVALTDSILFPTEDLRSLAFDDQGTLWAPVDEGLARIDDDGVTVLDGEAYPGRVARSVLVDSEGTLWIGTYGRGLVRYRDGTFSSVTEAQGLFEDVTSTLLEDDFGNLWMAGNQSIHRAAIRDLNAVLDGDLPRVVGVGYSRDDGIPNPETSGYSAAKDNGGRLWFPTFDGAVVVDPAAVFDLDATAPVVHVEGVRVGREAEARPRPPRGADGVRTLILDADERRFDVGFTAIDLRDPEGLRFQYILDDFDDGWRDAGESRSATYTNVAAGAYTFRVRALSGSGVASQEATLLLMVSPFFYETPAFFLLLVLAFGAGLALLLHVRERRGAARQAVLNRLVVERTRELSEAWKDTDDALQVVKAQAERLESLDRTRSRFFANVSHEFRTPLTLIVGPLRDLRRGKLGPLSEEAREGLDVVLESGERLTALVDQLLDVARLEVGELHLDLVPADVVPLLARVARSFDALARARDLDFEADLPAGPIVVSFDPNQFGKVLNNLLGNAFKFTEAHGRVALRARVDADAGSAGVVAIEVEDSGIGVPADAVERVFDRFFQADDSSKRRYRGAGVGLSLSRELVELHGGEIGLDSEVGRGTVVTVRLPLAPAGATPALPAMATAAAESPVGPPQDSPTADVPDPSAEDVTTVLLVEDEPQLRAYLRRHLEVEYRVVEASDGVAALKETLRIVPDLVISDVMMPNMDGEELVAAIRGNPDVSFLPVILLTARASREDLFSGLRGGADDYITKPFDIEEVLLRARNLIESRRRFRRRLEAEGVTVPIVPPPVGRDGAAAAFMGLVYEALVVDGMDEDFGVDGLAQALHMSRATLYRKSQDLLGRPPMEVVWEFRLDQGAQWLRETEVRVNEIAYGVGFKSVPHFSRKFRERFGVTPSAYRAGEGGTIGGAVGGDRSVTPGG
jgi:signal transduction histidine kinase/CheY-like chemotaxis protein